MPKISHILLIFTNPHKYSYKIKIIPKSIRKYCLFIPKTNSQNNTLSTTSPLFDKTRQTPLTLLKNKKRQLQVVALTGADDGTWCRAKRTPSCEHAKIKPQMRNTSTKVKVPKQKKEKQNAFRIKYWSWWRDLNPWPPPYQGGALPTVPHQHIFELPAYFIWIATYCQVIFYRNKKNWIIFSSYSY